MAKQDYSWIGSLEPRRVLEFFSDISAIPRETGNLEQISSAVESWIHGMGLKVVRDRFCNVKAFKPASPGYEDAPDVMLTAHLDMVCVKVPGSGHDFKKDPIHIKVQNGDTIRADGTTLGADDAIGAAMILAVLESETLRQSGA
jgi:dipeptidase D